MTAIGLLLGAVLACSVSLWELFSGYEQYRSDVSSLAGRQLKTPQIALSLPAKQVDAINQAIRQLNLPWPDLFAAVEHALNEHISLLALEPEASSQTLRIQAEAKTADDMLDFVTALQADKAFRSARLLRHEINENDKNKPYRFTLEAQWQTDL